MIKLNKLSCGYNANFNLKNVTVTIQENEITGVIGPNGSGKTTLLRAITKIIPIKSGSIIFENEQIEKLSPLELSRKIAVVSQAADIKEKITVEEFILLGRLPYRGKWQFLESKRDEEIVTEAMRLTNVYPFKNRDLMSLSGGERQLTVIARALAQEPKLLLLDEPTNHLDITHQVKILDLIKKLNIEKKITVLIVLHDLNLAAEYCDKLILLNNGNIHTMGTPREVLTYGIIEDVYHTVVVVKENPISKKPYIFLVSGQNKKGNNIFG